MNAPRAPVITHPTSISDSEGRNRSASANLQTRALWSGSSIGHANRERRDFHGFAGFMGTESNAVRE